MRILLSATLFCFLNSLLHPLAAQKETYTETADSLFAGINKSEVTSGIFYDRVLSVANLHEYDKSADTVEGALLEQAYFELYHAAFDQTGFLGIKEFEYLANLERFKKRIPVAVLDYHFHYLKPTAIQEGLLENVNESFFTIPGQNPFVLKRVQMAGLLNEKFQPGWLKFSLPGSLCRNNQGLSVSSVTLNFGAYGNKVLGVNQVDSVFIGQNGKIVFTITVQYSNGTSFSNLGQFEISDNSIYNPNGRLSQLETDPCFSELITSDIGFMGYDETEEYKGKNTVNYYYRNDPNIDCSQKQKRTLRKPIIIIDGFDPTNKRNAKWIKDSAFLYYSKTTNRVEDLGRELRNQGYDLIIVNHTEYIEGTRILESPAGPMLVERVVQGGGDYMERNAMVLIKVIEGINAQLQAQGSTEKIIIVGPSMGGQISRIALKYMEDHGMNHNCRLWISMDSNHEGAIVPIGLQEMAKEFARYFYKAYATLHYQINSPIAKQALIHHHLAASEAPAGAPGYFDRYNAYKNNLGWPQLLRKISGNSGAHNGQLQEGAFSCSPILELGTKWGRGTIPGFLTFYFGDPKNTQKVSLAPDKGEGRCEVLRMKLKLGLKEIIDKVVYAAHGNNRPYKASLEMLPAGHYPGFKEILDSMNSTNQVLFTSYLDEILYWLKKKKYSISDAVARSENHAHQLTSSTLAYGRGPRPNPSRKWDDDVSMLNLAAPCEGEIPFDGYFGPLNFNTRHDLLFDEQARWFMDEINGISRSFKKDIPLNIVCLNPGSIWCPGAVKIFSITNPAAATSYHWIVDNPHLAIVSGQGTSQVSVVYNYNGGNPNQSQLISASGENSCYRYSGSIRSNNGILVDPSILVGNYTYEGGIELPLRFGSTRPNIVNDKTSARVYVGASGSTVMYGMINVNYTLLNSPPIAYTWQVITDRGGNRTLVINAQPSLDESNALHFRVSYTNECDGIPRSAEFKIFFRRYRQGMAVQPGATVEIPVTLDKGERLQNGTAELYDMSGKLVSNAVAMISGNKILLDQVFVPAGIYTVKILTNKRPVTQKLFIRK